MVITVPGHGMAHVRSSSDSLRSLTRSAAWVITDQAQVEVQHVGRSREAVDGVVNLRGRVGGRGERE
eukprot:1777697-Rhodomonas_salina.3